MVEEGVETMMVSLAVCLFVLLLAAIVIVIYGGMLARGREEYATPERASWWQRTSGHDLGGDHGARYWTRDSP